MKKQSITFRIASTEKDEWQAHADKEFGGNISRMIRTAVANLIDPTFSTSYRNDGSDDNISIAALQAMFSQLNIRSRFDYIEKKLDEITATTDASDMEFDF